MCSYLEFEAQAPAPGAVDQHPMQYLWDMAPLALLLPCEPSDLQNRLQVSY
jgi:hypothetical protein